MSKTKNNITTIPTIEKSKEKTNSQPPVQPNKMYDILMEQHRKNIQRGIAMQKLNPYTKKGEAHPASIYTEKQVATAKAMFMAFMRQNLRVSYAAIAGVTGMKVASIRALFKKIRPAWSHVVPEQWEINQYAEQLDLVRLSKLNYRRQRIQKRDESMSTERARMKWLQESRVNQMDTGNMAVDELYTTILRMLGRKPDTFKDFMQEATQLVKKNTLDRVWFKRLTRSLIENQNNLYPTK